MPEQIVEQWGEYLKYLEHEKSLYFEYLREQGWLQHLVSLKEHQPSLEGFMTWLALNKSPKQSVNTSTEG